MRQPERVQAELDLADTQANKRLRLEMQTTRVQALKHDYDFAQARLAAFIDANAEAYASPDTEAERRQSVAHTKSEYEMAAIELRRLRQTLTLNVEQAENKLQYADAEQMNQRLSSYLNSKEMYDKAGWELEKMQRLLQIERQKAEQQLSIATHHTQNSTLRSPITGVVFKALAKPGEPTGRGVLFKLGDAETFFVVAEIYESDALRLRVGQAATISSYALPKKLQGTVESIGSMIFKNTVDSLDPSALSHSRVVEAHIRLESPKFAQKLVYLQVDVLIHKDQAKRQAAILPFMP